MGRGWAWRAWIDILYDASPRELEAISATFCALVGTNGTPRITPCASTDSPSGNGFDVRQLSTSPLPSLSAVGSLAAKPTGSTALPLSTPTSPLILGLCMHA